MLTFLALKVILKEAYPLNLSKRDTGPKVWVLNMVDYLTKVAEFVVVHTKEASSICRLFYDHWICRYGVPSVVTTDNGTEFQGEFTRMLKRLGINHVFTAVRHPQSNGAVERLNRTMKTNLKTHLHDNPTTWTLALAHMRQAYMNREHAATKYSPNQMLYGFSPRLPVAVRDVVVLGHFWTNPCGACK